MTPQTFMAQEAREAPEAVARFLTQNGTLLRDIGQRLTRLDPHVIITSARGSSDHAAAYFKYLAEIMTGVPCASIGASVVSVYASPLRLKSGFALTISQSGQSPDIVAVQEAARTSGALTLAIVNTADSPAGRNADICLPLHAGPEKSVAATKSFIVSLVAGAAIVAAWRGDEAFTNALQELPQHLDRAMEIDWPEMVEQMPAADSLYVLGRGPSLPIAGEAALKFKETCAIHAEAYSSAEVMHGPLELVGEAFPVLVFAQNDAARAGTYAAAERMRKAGARIWLVGEGGLPHARTGHPWLEPISMIATAYLTIERVAWARGRNPDQPRLLKKVTETV
jgi:glucosamine--fructose-6-phosphate aminotransferase (isomerizing)